MNSQGPASTKQPDESTITAFFDTQLFEGADLDRLIERAALFMRAAVGRVRDDGGGVARKGCGALTPVDSPLTAFSVPVVGSGGRVWVDGLPEPTARHFLNRLSAAVSIIERWGAALTHTESEPISVLINGTSSEAAHASALTRLGITRDTEIRFLLCGGPGVGVEHFAEAVADTQKIVARTDHQGKAVLLLMADGADGVTVPGVPVGVRAAYSRLVPAARTREAYVNAHDAYLFTRPSPHDRGPYQPIHGVLIDGARLTGLAALCRLSHDEIDAVPEVGVLAGLFEQYGEQILLVLEAYAITGSLRKAAAQVYLHHNSVAYWVQKAEAELGYSLAEPNRRAQFFLTVCLYRLWRQQDERV
ncbi:hypothetical protein Z951_15760 [Streptomyces sp. PRh5]|uniref:helix-turn-helix domain-containing protein n=1 Tax=Streptomyces sp. PRh5 TaxID=1158056 RepID=UPI00044AFD39|nr:helix-turn-helix domain-containing protein [Streptomyces sp. PRh5]EXU67333.1 hypothetical protein Z951_15760 [Streptomyces sp. PRh5]